MKLKLILFILGLWLPVCVFAQKVSGIESMPILPVSKNVYDTAHVLVYYEYEMLKDSLSENSKKLGQTILMIGDTYCSFGDYFQWKMDSLNDACCREKRSSMEFFTQGMALGQRKKCPYSVIKSKISRQATVLLSGFLHYQYTQSLPQIAWNLEEGDSTFLGVTCSKATCEFGGRKWTAWYSAEYPISYGPYLFDGLPGLIFVLEEEKGNFKFTMNGLVNDSVGKEVYLRKPSKLLETTREKALEAFHNESVDPTTIMTQVYHTTTANGSLADFTNRPYNPIEKE